MTTTEGPTLLLARTLHFHKCIFQRALLPVVSTAFSIWSSLLAPFSRSEAKGCLHEPWCFKSCQSFCTVPDWLCLRPCLLSWAGPAWFKHHVLQRHQHRIIALAGFPQQSWCRSFSQSQWLLPLLISDPQIDAIFSARYLFCRVLESPSS